MSGERVSLNDLLSHSGWIQALARHLVREDADDLVQDVWMQAMRAAPAEGGHQRSWLAKVLVNKVRNRARTHQRRATREESWAVEQAQQSCVLTPEETTIRGELHLRLATLVCELPEALRHVVYLRYVDGHEPTMIASLIGVPAGTVRWRLKDALDRLRTRLDEQESGGRTAWVGLLTPVTVRPDAEVSSLGTSVKVGRVRLVARTFPKGPVMMTLVVVAALLLAAAAWTYSGPRRTVAIDTQLSSVAHEPLPRGNLPRFTEVIADHDTCPDVKTMERLLGDLKRDLDPWRNPKDVFIEAEVNPLLEHQVAPVIAEAFQGAAEGCSHSVLCRGQVCLANFATPDHLDPRVCFPHTPRAFHDHLSSGFSNLVDSGTPEFDVLSKQGITMQHQYWRFEAADGSRVPLGERAPLKMPARAFARHVPVLPDGLRDGCADRWHQLRDEYRKLLVETAQFVPGMAWETSTNNAGLQMRVEAWAATILKRPSVGLPFAVACRGSVCAFTQTVDDDPLSVRWQCRPPDERHNTVCDPDRATRSWYQLLDKAASTSARLVPRMEHDASLKPIVYLVVSREEPVTFASMQSAIEFLDSFDWRRELQGCDDEGASTGALAGLLELPEGVEGSSGHKYFNVHIGGSGATSHAGRCVTGVFERAAQRHLVDEDRPGLAFYFDIPLPLDLSKFEKKIERVRRMVVEELAAPAL